jgi:hypothetical protein
VLRHGQDERVDNSAAIQFVDGIRQRGGQAWPPKELKRKPNPLPS